MANNYFEGNVAMTGGLIASNGELGNILYGHIFDESIHTANTTILFDDNKFFY